MGYFVTCEEVSKSSASSAPADQQASESFELADALAHACRLLDEGRRNVVITDGGRKSIGGEDLIACCHGDKEITADLTAVATDDPPGT